MRRNNDLESLLSQWGRDYGGGKYGRDLGAGSWLANMIRWGGRAPSGMGGAPDWQLADDVNEAVEALRRQDWAPAEVIRIEYTLPGQTREQKRQKLAALGLRMGDVRYCQHLRIAKIHIAGWLRIPFIDPLNIEGAVQMLEYVVTHDAQRSQQRA